MRRSTLRWKFSYMQLCISMSETQARRRLSSKSLASFVYGCRSPLRVLLLQKLDSPFMSGQHKGRSWPRQ